MRQIKFTNGFYTKGEESLFRYFTDVRHLSKSIEDKPVEERTPDELIKTHLKFAVSVAKKYMHLGIPVEDLVQDANIALINAAHKFDPSKGFQFTSYCVLAIRQYLIDEIRRNKSGIKFGADMRKKMNDLRELCDDLTQRDEYMYTIDEIKSLYPELFTEGLYRALNSENQIPSDSIDTDFASESDNVDQRIDQEYIKKKLHQLLHILTQKQQEVIKKLYFEEKSIEVVAGELNCTRENVRMTRENALRTLRKHKQFLI